MIKLILARLLGLGALLTVFQCQPTYGAIDQRHREPTLETIRLPAQYAIFNVYDKLLFDSEIETNGERPSSDCRPKHSLGPISQLFVPLQIPNFALVPLFLVGIAIALLGFKFAAYAADTRRDILIVPGFLIAFCGAGISSAVFTWVISP